MLCSRWAEPFDSQCPTPWGPSISPEQWPHSLKFVGKEIRYREVKGCQIQGYLCSNVCLPSVCSGLCCCQSSHCFQMPLGRVSFQIHRWKDHSLFQPSWPLLSQGCIYSGPIRASQVEPGPSAFHGVLNQGTWRPQAGWGAEGVVRKEDAGGHFQAVWWARQGLPAEHPSLASSAV